MPSIMDVEDDKKKLRSATRSVEKLKKLLNGSNDNCNKMCEILTHFDDRLKKLEETVKPVYKETNNLQKKQENNTLGRARLDYAIKFYTVVGEVRSTIISGPGATSFELYLRELDRLTEAMRYFECNNPESVEMLNVSALLEIGGTNIEKEFRSILSRHSSPLPIKTIIDLVTSSREKESENNNQKSPEKSQREATSQVIERNISDILPEKSRNELRK